MPVAMEFRTSSSSAKSLLPGGTDELRSIVAGKIKSGDGMTEMTWEAMGVAAYMAAVRNTPNTAIHIFYIN